MNPAEFSNIARSERDFWWYRGMRQILWNILDPFVSSRTIGRALDAGCGTGYFARLVEQRYEVPTYAVDFGWNGVRHASHAAQADVAKLPFAPGSFGLVLSMDVVVHFPKGGEQSAIREMSRVLARSGLLAIRVAALDILRSRHSQFAHERQRFTRTRLVQAIEREGLKVLRATYANSLLVPVALAKFRIWEPLTSKPPASGVERVSPWLDRILHSALAFEARMLRAGATLPIGQSVIVIAEKAA